MSRITQFCVQERVEFDERKVTHIGRALGPTTADHGMAQVLDTLAARIEAVAQAVEFGQFDRARDPTRGMVNIADELGLLSLAKAAEHFHDACRSNDFHAIAATACRVQRVGEMSIMAVWNTKNMSG